MSFSPQLWTQDTLHELISQRLSRYKFIVVSNREPFIHRRKGGRIQVMQATGGLTTALRPIMVASGGTWIAHGSGDADRSVTNASGHVRVPPGDPSYTLRRVWLTKEQEEGYYYGLANEGLWPLCHITFSRPVFRPKDWEKYREVNRLFADAVIEEAAGQPAIVFVQDYHFCLLPRMLKESGAENLIIAMFWHIPWPNRETFRTFPWHEELLDGLLGNDLLGFHVRYHCQNFLETVDRGIESMVDRERWEISRGGHITSVKPFPISIDYAQHEAHASSPEVEAEMEEWRQRLNLEGRKLGAGIERLDFTKGIPERLAAIDHLFETHPEWRGKLCFVQIAVPSRSRLPAYQAVEDAVDEWVEKINWRWGLEDWTPITLFKENHNQTQMTALHRLCDFLIVNSLHDGMNLVAKEFVASRTDEDGVLVLSRFTGAHRELDESIGVNPFAIDETAEAIHTALSMPETERRHRMKRMREKVAYNNVYRWAGKILAALLKFETADTAEGD